MERNTRILQSALLLATLAAPAAAQKKCDPVPELIARFVPTPVYTACEVSPRAEAPRELRTIGYTSDKLNCVRATVEIVVDSEGVPMLPTGRVASTNDSSFGAKVLAAVAAAKFTPAQKDGHPVAQWMSLQRSTQTLGHKGPFAVKRMDGPMPPPNSNNPSC